MSRIAGVTGLCLIHADKRCLRKTLASLDFCERILLVDSGSQPETLRIAQDFGAEVVHNAWQGFTAQYEFALGLIPSGWVVIVDQDEFLSPAAKDEVREFVKDAGDRQGMYLPRRAFYFDRFIEHSGWSPDHVLRCFKRDAVRLEGQDLHERFVVDGPTAMAANPIIHYPYASFGEHLARIEVYTRMAAKVMHQQGKKAGLASAVAHGAGRFAKHYMLRRGFLDGKAGFVLAVLGGLYGFLKYVRLWELNRHGAGPDGVPDWRGECGGDE